MSAIEAYLLQKLSLFLFRFVHVVLALNLVVIVVVFCRCRDATNQFLVASRRLPPLAPNGWCRLRRTYKTLVSALGRRNEGE